MPSLSTSLKTTCGSTVSKELSITQLGTLVAIQEKRKSSCLLQHWGVSTSLHNVMMVLTLYLTSRAYNNMCYLNEKYAPIEYMDKYDPALDPNITGLSIIPHLAEGLI
jgi:hypothetical protein